MGSLVSNSSSDVLSRGSNVPAFGNLSVCGWVKIASGVKAEASLVYALHFAGATSLAIVVDASGNLRFRKHTGGYATLIAAASLVEEEWYFIGLSHGPDGGGTNPNHCYVWGDDGTRFAISETNETTGSITYTGIAIANIYPGGGSASVKGKYAYWKTWDAALTESELADEQFSPTFVRTSSVNTGFADSVTDIGPNGRDWTANSMGYDSDSPPVIFPPTGLYPDAMTRRYQHLLIR